MIGNGENLQLSVPILAGNPSIFFKIHAEQIDSDSDGFSNWEESRQGSNPNIADSDNDGLLDFFELAYGLDIHNAQGVDGPNGDPDHDGFSNLKEQTGGSNPQSATSVPGGGGGGPGGGGGGGAGLGDPHPIQPLVLNRVSRSYGERSITYYDLPVYNYSFSSSKTYQFDTIILDEFQNYVGTSLGTSLSSIIGGRDGLTYPDFGSMSFTNPSATSVGSNFGLGYYTDFHSYPLTLSNGVDATGSTISYKVRLERETADTIPAGKSFVKVNSTADLVQTTINSFEKLTLTIPAGELHSDDVELTTDEENKVYELYDCAIELGENMSGVIGDEVQSQNAGSGIRHFVTPKKSSQLNQQYVMLEEKGVAEALIKPGDPRQIFEWDGGEPVPNQLTKRRVSRNATGKTEVKVRKKGGGEVISQFDVWVVWATATSTPGGPAFIKHPYYSEWRISRESNAGWRFKFTIEPSSIISGGTELPDLRGLQTKPVPGVGKTFTTEPFRGDGDTASFKWDVSRQISVSIRNPGLISKAALANSGIPAAWTANQPVASDVPVPFPADQAEGNDDPLLQDEDSNPYQANTTVELGHAMAGMSSFDAPGWGISNPAGVNGISYSARANFREFARLEIWDGKRDSGRYWFKISDDTKWNHAFTTTFADPPGVWNNAGSSSGLGIINP